MTKLKILITGDFCPHDRVMELIRQEDYAGIFNDFLPFIKESDIAITNLECPVTNSDIGIKKTGPNLKAPEKTIAALKFAGFNLVTLANNHILDYGTEGLNSTVELCRKSGIDYVGVGANLKEARKTFYCEIKGIRLAFVNFCENEWSTTSGNTPGAHPLDPVANYYDIKEARTKADHVIVIVHGGHEHYALPSPRMQETYRFFADAGASIVIGHHTHCISGYEIYKDIPIFYSLGNFIFDWNNQRNSPWNLGYAVQLKVSKDNVLFEILPYKQGEIIPGICLPDIHEKEKIIKDIIRLSDIIGNETLLNKAFETYAQKQKMTYEFYLEPFGSRLFSSLYFRNLLPSFLTTKKRNLLLNVVRCEAHRDLLLKSLNNTL